MAYEIDGKPAFTLIAGADLSTHQYKAVMVNSSGQAVLAATPGMRILGFVQNKPSAGLAATIWVNGITRAIAGAALNPGPVMVDASGRVVTATATNNVVGIALEGATAAGVHVPVVILPSGLL